MNIPIITSTGCKNCKFSAPSPANPTMRECHWGPPTANAIMVPDGKSGVRVAGVVSVFPLMNAEAKCWRYERGVAVINGDTVKAAG